MSNHCSIMFNSYTMGITKNSSRSEPKMKLLFSIHVEIMCDLSQLIIFLVKGGGRHETIQG